MKGFPKQPVVAATGTTVYITLTFALVVLVYASSASAVFANPFATAGAPAEAVRPLKLILVTLYVDAATPELAPKFIPIATSLHRVCVWFATKGSGLTGTVTVNEAPTQPRALTGATVYTTFLGIVEVLVNASSASAAAAKPVPIPGEPAEIDIPVKVSAVTL